MHTLPISKAHIRIVDLVAIQPDVRTIEKLSGILQNSNSSKENAHKPKFDTKLLESARRIKWVHHNFLSKRLPFKDAEFDYIHVRGIAAGVPEDKVRRPLLFPQNDFCIE